MRGDSGSESLCALGTHKPGSRKRRGDVYPREARVRAEATFGQPIAFGSFLIIPLVLAFAQRRWKILALIATGELLTLSRGPYVGALSALFLFAIVTRGVGRVAVVAVAGALAAIFVGPVSHTIGASFSPGTTEAANALYRSDLLHASLASATLWGHPLVNSTSLFTESGRLALTDVASQVALMVGEQGLIGLLIWVGLLLAVAQAIRIGLHRRDRLLTALGIAIVGLWISLLSVALITTFQYAFLMALALAAARLSATAARPGPRGPRTLDARRATRRPRPHVPSVAPGGGTPLESAGRLEALDCDSAWSTSGLRDLHTEIAANARSCSRAQLVVVLCCISLDATI